MKLMQTLPFQGKPLVTGSVNLVFDRHQLSCCSVSQVKAPFLIGYSQKTVAHLPSVAESEISNFCLATLVIRSGGPRKFRRISLVREGFK
mgnify:FL=1